MNIASTIVTFHYLLHQHQLIIGRHFAAITPMNSCSLLEECAKQCALYSCPGFSVFWNGTCHLFGHIDHMQNDRSVLSYIVGSNIDDPGQCKRYHVKYKQNNNNGISTGQDFPRKTPPGKVLSPTHSKAEGDGTKTERIPMKSTPPHKMLPTANSNDISNGTKMEQASTKFRCADGVDCPLKKTAQPTESLTQAKAIQSIQYSLQELSDVCGPTGLMIQTPLGRHCVVQTVHEHVDGNRAFHVCHNNKSILHRLVDEVKKVLHTLWFFRPENKGKKYTLWMVYYNYEIPYFNGNQCKVAYVTYQNSTYAHVEYGWKWCGDYADGYVCVK